MSWLPDMAPYAAYVWGSYAAGLVLLVGMAVMSWRRARVVAARLQDLEANAPHRRRRREGSDGD